MQAVCMQAVCVQAVYMQAVCVQAVYMQALCTRRARSLYTWRRACAWRSVRAAAGPQAGWHARPT